MAASRSHEGRISTLVNPQQSAQCDVHNNATEVEDDRENLSYSKLVAAASKLKPNTRHIKSLAVVSPGMEWLRITRSTVIGDLGSFYLSTVGAPDITSTKQVAGKRKVKARGHFSQLLLSSPSRSPTKHFHLHSLARIQYRVSDSKEAGKCHLFTRHRAIQITQEMCL